MPAAQGAYLFRLSPQLGVVPDWAPTRLLHVGGMGPSGTLFQRVGNFIGAALGRGGVGPQSSAGLKFGHYRSTEPWPITIRDVEVCYCVVDDPQRAHCADVSAWLWYWNTYRTGFQTLAATGNYPACDDAARWTCSHGRYTPHAWFVPPPSP